MGKWEMVRLGDVFSQSITGEWGTDCENEQGTKVLRTTNFTNLGKIDFNNVVMRRIDGKKIEVKRLQFGDIILEKSGGSDNQPVGRVVYFEDNSNNIFLCNNFTQALRTNASIADSKYVFYFMYYQHKTGVTELLQNKTTGIRNLQVKSYMALKIPLPPLPIQQKIANVLDRASALIEKRKAQIAKLDLLVKSQFIEMFGDGQHTLVRLEDICGFITKGTTPPTNKIHNVPTDKSIPYIKVYNLSDIGELRFHEEPQYIDTETHFSLLARSKVYPNDVLMNIVGLPLGKFALVTDDFTEWNINQAIAIFRSMGKVLPIYLMHSMMQPNVLRPFLEKAVGIRQVNLSLKQCRELEIPLPPLPLQNRFGEFVRQSDKSKSALQQSLEKLELNYKSLMQKCFRGEIF